MFRWCRRQPTACFALASACLVLLVYAQAFRIPFVYDDLLTIQHNTALASWSSIAHYFRQAVPLNNDYRGEAGSIYRPLVWLGFIIERRFWGLNPIGYHLVNLLFHWANGLLIFSLLRQLTVPARCAAAASLVWLALPINSEAVSWVSGRHTLQAAFFVLLALWFALRYTANKTPLLLACYFLAACAGLLSNEWAALFLPLTALTIWARGARGKGSWLPVAFAAVASFALYLPLRYHAGAHLPLGSLAIFPVGLSLLRYATWMLLPIGMSVERSTDTPPAAATLAAVLALAVVILFIVALWLGRRRFPWVAAGLAWTLLCLLPFSGVVFVYQGMAERYTYLPSIGLSFAAVAFTVYLQGRGRQSWLVFLTLWILAGVVRLQVRLVDWRSETSLYESSLATDPRSAVLLFNLGVIHSDAGDSDGAIRYYGRALAANPAYVAPLLNLANLLAAQGNYDEAIAFDKRATTLDPASSDPWIDLGNAYLQAKRLPEAQQAYRQALQVNSRAIDARLNLGALFAAQANLPAAAAQFRLAIALDSSYAPAYLDLALVLQRTGDRLQARAMFEKALALRPDYREARQALANLR